MITSIASPSNPLFPPAANQLWVSDNWANALGSAPTFAYKLQCVSKDETYDLIYLNVSMELEQWVNRPAGGDAKTDQEYILNCLSENLGLKRN